MSPVSGGLSDARVRSREVYPRIVDTVGGNMQGGVCFLRLLRGPLESLTG